MRKRIIAVMVWKPLSQISGDNALNPLIYLFDTLLSTHAQPRAGQQAQAKRGQQAQRKCLADDVGNLAGFVDLSSYRQCIAVRHSLGDRADQVRLSTGG